MPVQFRGRVGWLACVICLGAATPAVSLADPLSDTFQPDAFRTEEALRQRTPGLIDPLGKECLLPAHALTLPEAVEIALCRNPATREAWAAAHQQAAALGAAQGAWLPQVAAQGTGARDFGQHADVYGTLITQAQNSGDAALTLSWLLYDFGARDGRITSARHLLDAAAAATNRTVQQTVLAVIEGFYGLVAGDALLAAAQTTESTSAKSLDVARTLRNGGVATLADVLQAETAYDEAVIARVQAEYSDKAALGALAVALGLPAGQALKVSAEAVPDQVPTLTARMSDLMAEAMQQRPDLAAAQDARDAAEADVRVARAAGRPSISVTAGRDVIVSTGTPQENYSMLGVNVTVPLFSGFSIGYGVRQAQATLRSRDAALEQTRLTVSQDVWNAYHALNAANQELSETATLVKTAASNQDVALGRYQSGVGTIIDLLTAQNAAAGARQMRINAEMSWEVARAQLALALGRLTSAEPLQGNAFLP